MDSLFDAEEQDMVKALDSLIMFLGFKDFEKSDTSIWSDFLITEVYGFNDRRIFVSVIDNFDGNITGKCTIENKNGDTLDVIVFKLENNEWIEDDINEIEQEIK